MATIDTIFFDWGGVIAPDPGDDFLRQLLIDLGASQSQAEEIYETYLRRFMRGELSESAFWNELQAHHGLAVHEQISEEFSKWRGLETNQAVFSLVDQAKAAGLRTALLSNVIEPTYNVLEKAGYYKRFDAIIASCKVGYTKPQPEIYQLALQRLATSAEKALFIDDKAKCLEPAAAMGFHTILAQSPEQIVRDVTAYL